MVLVSVTSKTTLKGPAVLFVKAEWCGHCQNTKPEIRKAGDILGTVLPIYTIDGDKDKEKPFFKQLKRAGLKVDGYPTIAFLNAAGKVAHVFADFPRTGKKIADWACGHSGNCGRSSRAP